MGMRTLIVKADREIECKLTEAEKVARGYELATKLQERRAAAEQVSQERQEAKARMAEIDARIGELMDVIARATERRVTRVEDWAEHERGIVRTIRKDTGEEVAVRP